MTPPILTAEFDESGALVVTGEVDSYSAPEIGARCTEAEWSGVLDLRGVTFMDSSGIRLLVEANRNGEPPLVLRAPSDAVSRLLELSGVTASFVIEG